MPGEKVSVFDPEYYESTLAASVFSAMTALTGVAPGTALGTTAAFALHNPAGSNVNLVIIRGAMGYVSGTLGAGVITWNVNTDDDLAAPTGTGITELNCLLGAADPVGRALTTATIASPAAIRVFGNLQASLASTAVGPWQLKDDVDGAIIVKPGTTVSLHATAAAGSSPLVIFEVTWKEENVA